MTSQDRHFATYVNQLTEAAWWPDPPLTLTPWEVALGVVIAACDALASPNRHRTRLADERPAGEAMLSLSSPERR